VSNEPTLGTRFIKTGPYPDVPGGSWAFCYRCQDCDWSLVTIAKTDLLPINEDLLIQHSDWHIAGSTKEGTNDGR